LLEQCIEQSTEPSQEAVVKALLGARSAMVEIRNLMRQMGEAAGVPVGFFLFLCSRDTTFHIGVKCLWI
jgi:hypothetical protein